MGVHGLWRLIEPSGKPVPVESLENKVLAVDVSIWLHQAIKGFQDSKGASIPNAHLLGIYHRVCKLLYFRIQPVFIFDGGVPVLKKETIAKRNNLKSKNLSETYSLQKQLLNTLLKHSAVNKVISEKAMANMEKSIQKSPEKPTKNDSSDDMYKLPSSQLESSESLSDEEDESEEVRYIRKWDLHTIDEKSTHFKSLPADVRHEILTELKETRKQSSWGRIHELPTQSDDFSGYQMKRLLKRHSVQVSLEETEKEMGGHALSLGELEALLNDHGVITANDKIGGRIASNEGTRFLLIKDVKKALEEATNKTEIKAKSEEDTECDNKIIESENENESTQYLLIKDVKKALEEAANRTEIKAMSEGNPKIENRVIAVSEYERDLRKAIQLSLQDVPSTSKINDSDSYLEESDVSKVSLQDVPSTSKINESDSYLKESDVSKISSKNNAPHSLKTSNEEATVFNIKENNGMEIVKVNKEMKISENFAESFIVSQTKDIERNKDDKTKVQNSTAAKGTADVELLNKKTDNVEKGSRLVSVSSEHHSNLNFAKSKILQENQKSEVEIELMSDSNSDSDENFIEVDEQITPTTTNSSKKSENVMEIVIEAKDTLEEDMFADIFSSEHPKDILDLLQKRNDSEKSIENQINETATEKEIKDVITENLDSEKSQKGILVKESGIENSENVAKKIVETPLSIEKLQEMKINLATEKHDLIAEKSNKERLANSITDQMYQDAQELLQLFGVPYIVAPMEAEAQCAFLDQINLTDGTITDDSDIWLFGGTTVYKNFFNQSKHVMEFSSENIKHSFKLSRYEMILLALLVGSDYTTGIQGVGPVTALEILAAFPIKKPATVTENVINHYHLVSGLQEFQKWFKQGKVKGPGRAALRNKLKNIVLSDNFPSLQVVQAYLEPSVEKSRENFSWGKPDVTALVDFAREKFGWSKTKSEEILKPVMKRMEETVTQTKITNYFKVKHKIDSGCAEDKMSKRVKTAVTRMGKQNDEDLSGDDDVKVPNQVKKRSRKKVKQIENEMENDDDVKTLNQFKKQSRAKVKQIENEIQVEMENDDDVKVLNQVKKRSRKKVKQIENEIQTEIEKQTQKDKLIQEKVAAKAKVFTNLHKIEKIPQKEQDKANLLRSKLKAIEAFRKSRQGPGYVKKRENIRRALKEDAELSESSSD